MKSAPQQIQDEITEGTDYLNAGTDISLTLLILKASTALSIESFEEVKIYITDYHKKLRGKL